MVPLLASTVAPFVCAAPEAAASDRTDPAVDREEDDEAAGAVGGEEVGGAAEGEDEDSDEARAAEGDGHAPRAPPPTRDTHVLVSTFVDEHRARLSGAVVKATDLYNEVGAWVASRAPGVVLSFKALRATLQQAFNARTAAHVFGSGDACEAFAFPALVNARPGAPGGGSGRLREFLAMDDDERGFGVRRVHGRVTWMSDLASAYESTIGEKLVVDAAVLAAFGFTMLKKANVCRGCKQLSKGGKDRCCAAYDGGDRAQKAVIIDMSLSRF
jgi:hypothetical protein